jgi:hypothetical protein
VGRCGPVSGWQLHRRRVERMERAGSGMMSAASCAARPAWWQGGRSPARKS